MRQRLTAALLIASLGVVLSACTSNQFATPQTPPAAPSASSTIGAQAAIRAMTIAEKQSLIAANFKPEVPMPFGQVVKAEAQGDTAWDYELLIDASVPAVSSWYQEAYTGREWQMVDQSAPQVGSLTLTLTKNRAETRVTITPTSDGKARVVGILGVGAPVLQTQ
jgi:hypothetical protein